MMGLLEQRQESRIPCQCRTSLGLGFSVSFLDLPEHLMLQIPNHKMLWYQIVVRTTSCGLSSVGRAPAFQAGCHECESRTAHSLDADQIWPGGTRITPG